MASKKSKYDKFFFIRLAVLLLILVGFAAGIYVDRQVLIPAGMKAVDEIALANTREEVHKVAGRSPSRLRKVAGFEIETYEFSRILPFLSGPEINILYLEDQVSEAIKGPFTDAEAKTLTTPAQ